ncbi:MAG: DUF2273 domain-containing protein [Collinsella sp.]
MSDTNQDKTACTPRLTIDQNATPAGETTDTKRGRREHDSAAAALTRLWVSSRYGRCYLELRRAPPNTTLGAVAALSSPCWCYAGPVGHARHAFFVLIGAVIGQIRDGENGIVNFFGRCLAAANMYSTVASVADIRRNHGF